MSVTFAQVPRTNTPLIIGLAAPSGGGKTLSALELAHGFQDVQGGKIGMLDSEAGRGNHYQDTEMASDKTRKYKYEYAKFSAPFRPMNYQENIAAAVKQGIKHLIIDSMSHMHEGPGGILEWHEQEVERMSKNEAERGGKTYTGPNERHNLPAWQKPKMAVAHFRAFFTQQEINLIFCFRAKEKLKLVPGGKPVPLGFQPIITEELIFEMITCFLLYPGSGGVPNYTAMEAEEKKVIKIPKYFLPVFADQKKPLSVWHGKQMARWAMGSKDETKPAPAAATPAITPSTTPAADPSDSDSL